jgi:hypothetical protein
MPDAKNEFDVAKSVFDLLAGLKKEQQQRVLRWVAESLGIDEPESTAPRMPQGGPTSNLDEKEPRHPSSHPQVNRTADIKSFVASKNPKSDVQYVAVVAYYYRFEAPEANRKDAITSVILQESTRLVGRPRLDSPNTTLNNAKNLGYLDSVARGEFRINTVGENLVAMTLPGQGGSPGAGATGGARKNKKA